MPVSTLRILRTAQISIVGRNHPSLSSIHEDPRPSRLLFNAIAQRADQIRAEHPDARAQYLGVDGIIDQRDNRLPVFVHGLNYAHATVV